MRWTDHLLTALRRIRRRPVRSLLLLQGTVWGVAVAVFPSAVIQGTRASAVTLAREIGSDRVALAADPTAAVVSELTAGDVEVARAAAQAAGAPVLDAAGVRVVREFEAPGGAARLTEPLPALLAGPPRAAALRGHTLAAGRWLAPDDPPTACLVEAGVAGWLGLPPLAPGTRLRLPGSGTDLEVVGVLAARSERALSTDDLGYTLTHGVYTGVVQGFLLAMGIPIVRDGWKRSDRCVWTLAQPGERVDWIFLRVPPEHLSSTARAAREALARERRAVVSLHPIVLPLLLSGQVERFEAVNVAMFLACLAMGAVVMANLGLLNVLTRGREIAVRRVEGATQRDIALQFLLEGLLLAAVGSALGLGLGMLLAEVRAQVEPVAGFDWVFPPREATLAVLTALGVGLLAALVPAVRAARQDPVEGLADE